MKLKQDFPENKSLFPSLENFNFSSEFNLNIESDESLLHVLSSLADRNRVVVFFFIFLVLIQFQIIPELLLVLTESWTRGFGSGGATKLWSAGGGVGGGITSSSSGGCIGLPGFISHWKGIPSPIRWKEDWLLSTEEETRERTILLRNEPSFSIAKAVLWSLQ